MEEKHWADKISEDDQSIMCVTEQRSGEPSVIRYVTRTLHSNGGELWLIFTEYSQSTVKNPHLVRLNQLAKSQEQYLTPRNNNSFH